MKRNFCLILLFTFLVVSIAQSAGGVMIYINNKPYPGKIYTYEQSVYVEAKELMTFMNIPHSCTDTEIKLNDADLQFKLYGIAVWIDYNDGRGKVISLPLKEVATTMEGRYVYYPDTNTIDMYTFTRATDMNADTPGAITTTASGKEENPNSAVTTNPSGSGGVNPFNTGGILNSAEDAVDSYNGQTNSGGF